jgi:uncharacterized protein (DUF433 family)
MKQITIQVQDDQQVEQIRDVLSDFDFITSIDVDTLWFANGQENDIIKIIETDIGPLISESRASVYDVMEVDEEGYNPSEIGDIYNLSPHQVDVALAYVTQHRATLEPKLKEILRKAAEREQYHRTLVAEREQQFAREITPERIKFNKLLERSRRNREPA